MEKNRFLYLLIILFSCLIIFPFVHLFIISSIMIKLFFSIVLISSLYVLASNRSLFILGLILCSLSLLGEWILYIYPSSFLQILAEVFSLVFFILIVTVMFKKVFFAKKISIDMVFGASCIYLFLGISFATLYSLIEILIPGSFSSGIAGSMADSSFSYYQSLSEDLIYYSFVTLTTLGYGDITPISAPAKFLSILEAVFGQLYLAIAIARSVGMYISEKRTNL